MGWQLLYCGGLLLVSLMRACANNSLRFNASLIPTVKKVPGADLTLMISITTGPNNRWLRNAARESWLLPCKLSPFCDYRFFVDILNVSVPHFSHVVEENATYNGDMVARDASYCAFMQERHIHPSINYGTVFKKPWVYGGGGAPYYNLRALYKIDWKVCFAKYALKHDLMARYHAYVEDDHYVCTENLLFQLTLLKKLDTPERPQRNFRIGDPKWDGFDDNLTLMTREIVLAFAQHYPEPGFNCSNMADEGDPAKKAFLSWGNSWMSKYCGWREELSTHLNITFIVPWTWKQLFPCPPQLDVPPPPHLVNATRKPSARPTLAPTFASSTSLRIELKCPQTAPVVHNHAQGLFLRYETYVDHVCEFCLLVHKVSERGGGGGGGEMGMLADIHINTYIYIHANKLQHYQPPSPPHTGLLRRHGLPLGQRHGPRLPQSHRPLPQRRHRRLARAAQSYRGEAGHLPRRPQRDGVPGVAPTAEGAAGRGVWARRGGPGPGPGSCGRGCGRGCGRWGEGGCRHTVYAFVLCVKGV